MDLNVDGSTPQLVDAATMGRAASKFEGSEEALAVLARAATTLHVEQNAFFGCSRFRASLSMWCSPRDFYKGQCGDSEASHHWTAGFSWGAAF